MSLRRRIGVAGVGGVLVVAGLLWAGVMVERVEGRTGVDIWSRTILHPDGSRTISKKDTNAQVINQETLNATGQLIMKRVYQLDAEGKEQRGFVFDSRNQLIYRIGFFYDEIGRLKEEALYNTLGVVVRRQIYEYDRVGNLIRPVKAFTFEGAIPANAVSPDRALMSAEEMSRAAAGGRSGETSSSKEKKPGIFKRIFGKKDKK
ncbi:MAG: hypothetical protein AAF591_03470 [Verrucomicrobiota bacterium]